MKCSFDKQVSLSRVPEGPLAAHIGAFARSLREQGYTLRSIRRHVLLASCFNGWLKQREIAVCSITPEQSAQYLRYRSRQVRLWPEDGSAFSKLLCFLQCEGIIPAKRVPAHQPTPVERCTRAYERHLREARGLARATILNYVTFIRNFLKDRFGDGPVTLSRLCASDVVRFVQRQGGVDHPRHQVR
jgi:hypothetical protein